jgi:hypothetical protein
MLNFVYLLMLLFVRIGIGLTFVFLMLSVTACAPVQTAPDFSPCQHPLIDPSTQGGLSQGLLAYVQEVDACNARNGYEETK